jgi:hypothetical protein
VGEFEHLGPLDMMMEYVRCSNKIIANCFCSPLFLPSKHIIMHSFILFHKSDIELQILYRVASESNLQLMETVTAGLHHKLIYKSFRRLLKELPHCFC